MSIISIEFKRICVTTVVPKFLNFRQNSNISSETFSKHQASVLKANLPKYFSSQECWGAHTCTVCSLWVLEPLVGNHGIFDQHRTANAKVVEILKKKVTSIFPSHELKRLRWGIYPDTQIVMTSTLSRGQVRGISFSPLAPEKSNLNSFFKH
eukprot:g25667.t1